MFERRSLRWPITIAVIMIVLLIALAVGWVLLNVAGAYSNGERATLYWILLSAGSAIFVCIIVGIVFYLWLSIQQINLNRRQSNFIDSVTHELKSPIASLKLYLQTLDRRQVTETQRSDFYHSMMADVDRLDQLINHLLEAARIERPKFSNDTEMVSLEDIIEQSIEGACKRYNVSTDCVHRSLEKLALMASAHDMNMLLGNLIDNAVKYSGTPPQVAVHLESVPGKDWCRILVIDNGPGIPKHFRSKVFGRFYRVGSELERSKPGTGLGLFIVRTLVKRFGGRIQIQDAPSGQGTQIVVQLPGCFSTEEATKQKQLTSHLSPSSPSSPPAPNS
jgi:signal transduction histidine kinase